MIAKPSSTEKGLRAFTSVWLGQLLSLLGTNMTGFAIPIYIYGETERVRELGLLGLAYTLPLILLSPLTGALVDRFDRKLVMILSDLVSGLMTIVVLVLVLTDQLQVWHLFITSAVSGIFQGLQWPAYSAAISVMLPKKHYGRAHGMISLAQSGSNVFAPLVAAAVLGVAGLRLVLIIDIVTFVFAIGAILVVAIPNPPRTAEGEAGQGSIWHEAAYGFQYIWARPSLLLLQLFFTLGNFLAVLAVTVLPAMILARTNQNELTLGTVQSVGAIGGVAGALLMSAWGGPKPLIRGVLGGWFLIGLTGGSFMGLGQSVALWAAGSFCVGFFVPFINGCNQAIWQAKVAPDVQGRVFSIRRLIAWATNPLAMLLVIPLADDLLEPAMRQGGALADRLDWLVGTGPGAGMALIFVFAGLGIVIMAVVAYSTTRVRDVEKLLPDHELAREGEDEVSAEIVSEEWVNVDSPETNSPEN